MATTTFEMNYQRLYEIDITPETTATYVRLAKGLKSADPSYNEDKDQTAYLNGNGFKSTDVTAKQAVIAFSGVRVKGDSAQDFIFGKVLELGDSLKTNFRRTDAFGNILSGACTLCAIDDGGGDAGSKVEVGFEVHLNGMPSYTPGAAATALVATVAAGSVSGCTKFTVVTPGAGNHLGYKLKAASVGTVNGGSFVDGYVTYTSGADIAAEAGQFLAMYEIDANERVVKFLEDTLASGDIAAA